MALDLSHANHEGVTFEASGSELRAFADTLTVVFDTEWPVSRPAVTHVIAVGSDTAPTWVTDADVWLEDLDFATTVPLVDKTYRKYAGASYATTPTQTAFNLGSADWEFRAQLRLVNTRPTADMYLFSTGYSGSSSTGYNFLIRTTGQMRMTAFYDDTGEPSTSWWAAANLPTPTLDDTPFWVSYRRSGTTWLMRYSTDGTAWTTVDTKTAESRGLRDCDQAVGTAIASINTSGTLSTVYAADDPMDIMRMQLYTGGVVDSGTETLALDFDPREATTGTPATLVSGTGETYTFNGSTWAIVELTA